MLAMVFYVQSCERHSRGRACLSEGEITDFVMDCK